MRSIFGVAAAVAIAAATACGGSSKPHAASTATPVSDDVFKAAAEQAARISLLTLGDMPAGWTATAHTNDPSSKLDLPAQCQLLNEDVLPNAVVDKDADDFAGTGPEMVGSGVAVYRTAELAATNTSEFADTETRCTDELATAIKEALSAGAQAQDVTASVTEVPVPAVSSAHLLRAAFSGHVAGRTVTGHFDFGFVVSGRIASGISLFLLDGTPSPPRIEDLLALMLQRAAAADGALPD